MAKIRSKTKRQKSDITYKISASKFINSKDCQL